MRQGYAARCQWSGVGRLPPSSVACPLLAVGRHASSSGHEMTHLLCDHGLHPTLSGAAQASCAIKEAENWCRKSGISKLRGGFFLETAEKHAVPRAPVVNAAVQDKSSLQAQSAVVKCLYLSVCSTYHQRGFAALG